jgi:hypothetical protein
VILYTILCLLYLLGLVLCYKVASKNEEFIKAFTELPPIGAWGLFLVVLLAWPVVFALGVVSLLIKKFK